MEIRTKSIAPEILLEQYRQILAEDPQARELPLLVTGNSMSPFLIGGRDTVFLSRLEREPRKGDILLYRRTPGGYVLHRVYRITGDNLTMLGDAQTLPEPGIRREQVIAVVTRVSRKGKELAPGSFWWVFFEKYWLRMVSLRHIVHNLYTCVRNRTDR